MGCASPNAEKTLDEVAYSETVIWPSFPSTLIEPRDIEILLPPSYSEEKEYPIVYMMDGQNLFSVEGSHWGKSWEIDDSLDSLNAEDPLRQMIIVGIHSVPTRFLEYCPQKPVLTLPIDSMQSWRGGIDPQEVYSDSFLRFIVEELKPAVDDSLNTASDRSHTFIAGSSMGGLISVYAAMEYPQIFSGAACISTHWPLRLDSDSRLFPNAMVDYLSAKIGAIDLKPRLYFDCGTATLDKTYARHQARVDSLFQANGYSESNYKTLIFQGAEHDEIAWRTDNRSTEALRFVRGLD